MLSRRSFLATSCVALTGLIWPRRWAFAAAPHPTPRAGITAAKVLTSVQLGGDAELIEIFDGVRAIPQIVDGIHCYCGCANLPDKYSLLSCYEGDGAMATYCPICQGEGRLVTRLHKDGKTLAEIRVAIDAKFG